MDVKRVLKLNIPDIHSIYGGLRGKTMSSRSQAYVWPVVKETGVETIIDLRNDCMSQRMKRLCEEYSMEYFYYPVDNRADDEFKRRKQIINNQQSSQIIL